MRVAFNESQITYRRHSKGVECRS